MAENMSEKCDSILDFDITYALPVGKRDDYLELKERGVVSTPAEAVAKGLLQCITCYDYDAIVADYVEKWYCTNKLDIVGAVMKDSKGKANPAKVLEAFERYNERKTDVNEKLKTRLRCCRRH